LGVAPTSDPKFDALVGLGSNAAVHVATVAAQVVDAFLENVRLTQKSRDPYVVGPQLVREEGLIRYGNSLHEGYDGLNGFEKDFAQALDGIALPWCRNPSRTGYKIPLATMGPTVYFYPDFLIWSGDDVFALDTKGGHLISEAASRKLLWIEPPTNATTRVFVRLVAEGKWKPDATLVTGDGYSLWGIQPGTGRTTTHFDTLSELMDATLVGRRG
jgi:type III restriction enzyme